MQTHSERKRAFTLIELLIVIAVIALLIAIALPTMTRVRERSRRVACQAAMRSFHLALTAYAANHSEFLPEGGLSAPYHYIIAMQPAVYESLGGEFLCPNLLNPFRGEPANIFSGGSYQRGDDYYLLAYCYLGGQPDTPWPLTDASMTEWKSPQRTTERSQLPILTEMNAWIAQYNITFAPHGPRGPVHEAGDSTNQSRRGIPSDQIGAVGGNICTLDGSIEWKPMEEMTVHRASADPAANLQAYW
jgi:prepilin-type N-terminal cleavage/methylation domain-containing protein